jgi:hypothetical protein
MYLKDLLSLADVSITAALANQITTPLTGLAGLSGLSFWARFSGTGGTSVDAWLQQSPDQGASWMDIANAHFTAAGVAPFALVHGATGAPLTVTDGALAANTALNSGVLPLFDQFRIKWTSVGTWTAGLLTCRLMPRG